jgi:chromatin remodeling complex protein RSC6
MKKTKNARWRLKQEEMWKKRQLAAIAEKEQDGNTSAQLQKLSVQLNKLNLESGIQAAVDKAVERSLPQLARLIVHEQSTQANRSVKRGQKEAAPSTHRSSEPGRKERRRSEPGEGRSLLDDLKELWA